MHGHYVRRRSVPHERIHPKRPPTGPQPGTRAKTSNHRSDRALGPLRHRRVGTQSNLGPPPPPDVAVGPPSRPQRGPYTTPRTTSRRWRVQLCPWGVLDARWAVARAIIVALNQKTQNAKWADTNGHDRGSQLVSESVNCGDVTKWTALAPIHLATYLRIAPIHLEPMRSIW